MVRRDSEIARALGVPQDCTPAAYAAGLLNVGVDHPDRYVAEFDIPADMVDYWCALADDLGSCLWDDKRVSVRERTAWATREAARRSDPTRALGVLAQLAPHEHIPAGPARDMPRALAALTARHLPKLIGRVLHDWTARGLLVNVDPVSRVG